MERKRDPVRKILKKQQKKRIREKEKETRMQHLRVIMISLIRKMILLTMKEGLRHDKSIDTYIKLFGK